MHFFIQVILKSLKTLLEALQHVSIFYEIIFREFFIYFLVDVADIKIIKIFKKYYQSIVVVWQHMFSMHVMRTECCLLGSVYTPSNKQHSVQLTAPHSTHYMHTKHMLPHNHDELIILFKYFNSF